MENNLNINLTEVSKNFTTRKVSTIKNFKAMLKGAELMEEEIFTALDNISLKINEGEEVGIIGPNGAGKTTLLNIIAGFATSSSGSVEVFGKVNAVMTMGLVLKDDLTGIENIYLDGEMHGKTTREIDAMVDEIAGFADIGEYIDKPVQTYSSGMKARLSFSMLSFIEPEILIIDEVLGAGDADFCQKSTAKIQELCSKGKILLVVSHSMKAIVQMTQRCIWLDKGRIMMDGDSKTVTEAYLEAARKKEEQDLREKFLKRMESGTKGGIAAIKDMKVLTEQRTERSIFQLNDEVAILISMEVVEDLFDWDIRLSVLKMDGVLLMQNRASEDGGTLPPMRKGDTRDILITLGKISFAEGVYEVLCELLSGDKTISSSIAVLKIENLVITSPSKPDYYCDYEWLVM
jgi:lipopolysaccharide transport system ATP-binding protein